MLESPRYFRCLCLAGGLALSSVFASSLALARGAQENGLEGTRWQLVAIPSVDGASGLAEVPARQRYFVEFAQEGKTLWRIDCNRGFGRWTAQPSDSASGALSFGPVALTRALCPPGSIDHAVTQQLSRVRFYQLKDGRLYLSLVADGGILVWVETE